jgi:hypothetical protein
VRFAFYSCHYEISLYDFRVLLLNSRLRFRYEIACFLLHNFLTRFPNKISCFHAVVRCLFENCRVLLHTFRMRFRAFWPLWNVLVRL